MLGTPPVRSPLISLLLPAALILVLSACGRTAAFDELTEQEEQTVEQTEPAPGSGDDGVGQPGGDDAGQPGDDDAGQPGDDDAGQPGAGYDDDATDPAPEVDLTYDEEPRVNGEHVTEETPDEMDLDGALWIDGKKTCEVGSVGRCN